MSNDIPPQQPQPWQTYPPPQPGYAPQLAQPGHQPPGYPPHHGYPPPSPTQPWPPHAANLPAPPHDAHSRAIPEGNKGFVVTLALSVLLGMFGVDRFYLRKTGSALLKLVTLGGFGYWWLIDVILTLTGHQRDSLGLRLHGYEKHKKTVWKVIGGYLGISLALSIFVRMVFSPAHGGLTTFGWVLVGTLAAGGLALGGVWFTRYRTRRKAMEDAHQDDPLPSRVRAELDRLHELRPAYSSHAKTGSSSADAVVKEIDSLTKNVPELFQRLKNKADKEQHGFARAEYADKLSRLVAALGHDYMLDLIINPHLWTNSEKHVRNVQSALEAVNTQVLDNIRSVNSVSGLVFQVSLDGLDGVEGLEGIEQPRRPSDG